MSALAHPLLLFGLPIILALTVALPATVAHAADDPEGPSSLTEPIMEGVADVLGNVVDMTEVGMDAVETSHESAVEADGAQAAPAQAADEAGSAKTAASVQTQAVTVTTEPAAATGQDGAAQQAPAMKADTITVEGVTLPFIDYFGAASAPSSGVGLWMGSDSTTDGTWGYFIGHNPGDFSCVMNLVSGNPVSVCDDAGNARTYHVVDTFTVPDTTYWEDIESRVTGWGESVILQTCCGDNANYRIVVAA